MKKTAVLVILSLLVLSVASVASAEEAAAIYKTKCAVCHGATGAGDTGMGKNLKLRPLGGAEVQGLSDADLTKIISEGKGKMPAYGSKLSAADIKGLVTFIRSLKK